MSIARPPRRRIVGVSLKMYFDYHSTLKYVFDIVREAERDSRFPPVEKDVQALDIFLIPEFVSIPPTTEKLHQSCCNFWVGAQDTYFEDHGAFTGEVSPASLAQIGCRLVEIGHAERRALFGETDENVARKAAAVARHGMIPLVCMGEKVGNCGVDAAADECWAQVCGVFDLVTDDTETVLAYEPIWAIGAAEPAGPEHIVAVTHRLRTRILKERPGRLDVSFRIIYGGSAKPGLYEHIYKTCDGMFLGRFAHKPAQFLQAVFEVYATGRETLSVSDP